MTIKKQDKLIEVVLISPHVADFIYEKENGSYYAEYHGRGKPYRHELSKNPEGTPKWIVGEKIE